jgi:hypothetical protein
VQGRALGQQPRHAPSHFERPQQPAYGHDAVNPQPGRVRRAGDRPERPAEGEPDDLAARGAARPAIAAGAGLPLSAGT